MKILSAVIALTVAFAVTVSGMVSAETKNVVLTTSMLGEAVNEVRPGGAEIEVYRILPPSSCPGHFDLSPRIVPVLKSASVVMRHDYQKMLDDKIDALGVKGGSKLVVVTDGTPLIPKYYKQIAEQTGEMYKSLFPERKADIDANIAAVDNRLEELEQRISDRKESFRGRKIIAAVHVKEFCEWLGFDVVGVLKRPEETSPRDLEQLVGLDAEMIAGNLQEGMQSAVSLASRMDIPVAILSNFPGAEDYGESYYDLIEENVTRLGDAWQKQ